MDEEEIRRDDEKEEKYEVTFDSGLLGMSS